MTFGEHIIKFHEEIQPNWKIPKDIHLIYPFSDAETQRVFSLFYKKYFNDNERRTFLFGINPGRFGAGVTGISFTDPKILEDICDIPNGFDKRQELSSRFIYEMINEYGGPDKFYREYYIASICPLGFISKGKNVNYYDDASLLKAVEPYIIHNIKTQIAFGCNTERAFCIGQGKNFAFLKKINGEHQFFKEVIPLPHPRWVMQYRLKTKQIYLDEYMTKLSGEPS